MSKKKQGAFLNELQSKKIPNKIAPFTWAKDVSGGAKPKPQSLGLTDKKKYSEPKKKSQLMVQEAVQFREKIRKED